MPAPIVVAGLAAASAAARAVAGIMGKGQKYVNPVYKNQFTSKKGLETLKTISYKQQLVSKAKKEVAAYTVGAVGTTALVGSKMYKREKKIKDFNKKYGK